MLVLHKFFFFIIFHGLWWQCRTDRLQRWSVISLKPSTIVIPTNLYHSLQSKHAEKWNYTSIQLQYAHLKLWKQQSCVTNLTVGGVWGGICAFQRGSRSNKNLLRQRVHNGWRQTLPDKSKLCDILRGRMTDRHAHVWRGKEERKNMRNRNKGVNMDSKVMD